VANIGLFFGSDEGSTEAAAKKIQIVLGESNVDVFDITDATQLDFLAYDIVILGIPTWDFGQIQSDWAEFWSDAEAIDYSGKRVALFGLGDQFGYGDFFLDAMGMLHDLIRGNGASLVGYWSDRGYEYDASKAKIDGKSLFVGLALDEDQQAELSDERIYAWCVQIVGELGLHYELTQLE
jgi:flavodoxin I